MVYDGIVGNMTMSAHIVMYRSIISFPSDAELEGASLQYAGWSSVGHQLVSIMRTGHALLRVQSEVLAYTDGCFLQC